MGRLEPSFQIQAPIQTQLPASKVSSGRCYLNGPLAADGAATSPSVFLDVFHLAAAAAAVSVSFPHTESILTCQVARRDSASSF